MTKNFTFKGIIMACGWYDQGEEWTPFSVTDASDVTINVGEGVGYRDGVVGTRYVPTGESDFKIVREMTFSAAKAAVS